MLIFVPPLKKVITSNQCPNSLFSSQKRCDNESSLSISVHLYFHSKNVRHGQLPLLSPASGNPENKHIKNFQRHCLKNNHKSQKYGRNGNPDYSSKVKA